MRASESFLFGYTGELLEAVLSGGDYFNVSKQITQATHHHLSRAKFINEKRFVGEWFCNRFYHPAPAPIPYPSPLAFLILLNMFNNEGIDEAIKNTSSVGGMVAKYHRERIKFNLLDQRTR